MGNLEFNSAETEPTSMEFEPLPAGWYMLKIVDTEKKTTKAGDGEYLKIAFDIVGGINTGAGKGRKHWENFNLWNPSEKAQQIARGQFSGLCRACGKIGLVKDSSELHGKIIEARLKVVPPQNGYEAKNAVVEYRAPEKPAAGMPANDTMPF